MAREEAERQEQQYKEETGRQRRQYAQRRQRPEARPSQEEEYRAREEVAPEPEPESQTYQSEGATVIDNRHQRRENKKIFDDSDGEYVEFVEEK